MTDPLDSLAVWVVITPLLTFMAVLLYGMTFRWESPRGDADVIYDRFPPEKRKPYRVIYRKVVRLRYYWQPTVLGYYRWKWSAWLHAKIWDHAVLPSGEIWVEKLKEN